MVWDDGLCITDFHPKILYLTGTKDQVAKIAKAYRVYFSKADEEDEDNYLVDHSIVLYLVSRHYDNDRSCPRLRRWEV